MQMLRRFARMVMMLMPLALAWGGGFFLVVQNKDAGLTVEAQGCQDYSHARITGQAEGIVNGERQSMSLDLTPTGKPGTDRKSTRLNSSHLGISYAVFCLKKKDT